MSQEGNKSANATLLDSMEQVNFADLFHMILVNKWLIACAMFCCFFASIFYMVFKTPIYTADVLLQVESHANPLEEMGKMGGASFGGRNATSPADVQIALIKSRVVLAPVVQALGLDLKVTPDYFPIIGKAFANVHSDGLSKPFFGLSRFAWGGEKIKINEFIVPPISKDQKYTLVALPNAEYALYYPDGRFVLKGKVGQKATATIPDIGEFSLTISTLIANPHTHFFLEKKPTQAFIDQLAKNVKINDLSVANELNVGDTGILKLQLDGPDPAYLVSVLNAMARVAVEKNIEKKTAENTQTLLFLNKEIPQVKQSLDETEQTLNAYLASHHMVDLNTQSKLLLTELTETDKNLELVRMSRAQALQEYTNEHPYVIGLNEKEKVLQTELGNLQGKVSQLPSQDQEVVKIMRDVRVKSQLYLILLHQAQSMEVSKAGTVSDVLILDGAHLPEGPIPFSKITFVFGSLLAGFILGAVIIVVRNMLHQQISDPMVMEDQFGIPNMAIIPYSGKQHELYEMYNPKTSLVPMLAQFDNKDLSIEALRSFRTSLQFSMLDAANNILTITGIAPGVGKSFISANFAYLLADSGKKILLIDADLRKGHLRDYFKIGKPEGLTEVICGSTTFEQAVIHGSLPTLDFLATGIYPPNPSELLMSHHFQELLNKVSKLYDLVIIDTPPILAVTDAAIIGRYASANYIVVASDMHDKPEVKLALKRFESNGVRINGAIFNFSKLQKGLYRSAQAHKYGKYQYEYK